MSRARPRKRADLQGAIAAAHESAAGPVADLPRAAGGGALVTHCVS